MRTLKLLLPLVLLLPLAGHAAIVDIHVTSAADSGPNTLRQAIIDGNAMTANNNAPRILIDLDSTTPIVLASPLPSMTAPAFQIIGTKPGRAKIDGAGLHRILVADPAVLLFLLRNVAVFNGYSSSAASACLEVGNAGGSGFSTLDGVWFQNCKQSSAGIANGAAVIASHNLTIKNSIFQFNQSIGESSTQGAAIMLLSDSDLKITASHFSSNQAISNSSTGGARAEGGAIYILNGNSLTIEDSVFSGNRARTPNDGSAGIRFGGALSVRLDKAMVVKRSAFSNNMAGEGGAIHHRGNSLADATVSLRNVTAFDNRASGSGGALVSNSTLYLDNNTFWKNSAGVAGDNLAGSGTDANIYSAYHNLFAAGAGVGDSCTNFTTSFSSGYNIIPAPECGLGGSTTDQITNDLRIRGAYLGPGLNYTVELYQGSPALDAGNPLPPADDTFARCPELDGIGQPRPVDASGTGAPPRCDIGALEAQSEPSLFIDDFDGRWLRP